MFLKNIKNKKGGIYAFINLVPGLILASPGTMGSHSTYKSHHILSEYESIDTYGAYLGVSHHTVSIFQDGKSIKFNSRLVYVKPKWLTLINYKQFALRLASDLMV